MNVTESEVTPLPSVVVSKPSEEIKPPNSSIFQATIQLLFNSTGDLQTWFLETDFRSRVVLVLTLVFIFNTVLMQVAWATYGERIVLFFKKQGKNSKKSPRDSTQDTKEDNTTTTPEEVGSQHLKRE